MIDIAFSKLAIIGAAALVFIGPEKLPRVARMAGTLLGRAQRYINEVKSEVSREMQLDEFRKMHKDVEEAAGTVGAAFKNDFDMHESEMRSIFSDNAPKPYAGDGGSAERHLEDGFAASRQIEKSKNFRQKKLARTSALPAWYKQQNGRRSRVLSGAGRVAKYRGPNISGKTPASFH
ncbi:MAG: Sec-independent protein translocase subunit TatA/TatB [Janthinobacterium lividum]